MHHAFKKIAKICFCFFFLRFAWELYCMLISLIFFIIEVLLVFHLQGQINIVIIYIYFFLAISFSESRKIQSMFLYDWSDRRPMYEYSLRLWLSILFAQETYNSFKNRRLHRAYNFYLLLVFEKETIKFKKTLQFLGRGISKISNRYTLLNSFTHKCLVLSHCCHIYLKIPPLNSPYASWCISPRCFSTKRKLVYS